MAAYYNEIDPYAAQWLRNLIANKLIADGDVDERSICDVVATDLRGYTQCHFFAGIGVWSYALRLAGWPDDRPVWTGSCPCQPFSAAGKGKGFDDERHLWPIFYRLIAECRPPVVFGEQVASKDGLQWLDTVQSDMEASGYAIGAADMCAAGIGAPHIRQRLWFVGERLADASNQRHERNKKTGWETQWRVEHRDDAGGLADAVRGRAGHDTGEGVGAQAEAHGEDRGLSRERLRAGVEGALRGMADASHDGRQQGWDGSDLRWLSPAQGEARGEGGERAVPFECGSGLLRLADAECGERGSSGLRRLRQADGAEGSGASAEFAGSRDDGGLADAKSAGPSYGRTGSIQPFTSVNSGADGGMADTCDDGSQGRLRGGQNEERQTLNGSVGCDGADRRPSPTNGHWRDADWLFCRDGKWRPVEPGTFPLAHGATARVGRLRAYGNAIVPQVAAEVIGAYLAT